MPTEGLPLGFLFLPNMHQQTTETLLMVRPEDFAFNEQTATDNEFQHSLPGQDVRSLALAEFQGAVALLRLEGVEVLVVEKQPGTPSMPDAVFPNNWLGTDAEGTVHVFPMKTPNRQAETGQLPQVLSLLAGAGFSTPVLRDWRLELGAGAVLEGTGSLIFDRVHKVVYAALSERTQKEATLHFAQRVGYEAVLFHTQSSKGFAYYHTNVVLSIGASMALVCLECVPDPVEREALKTALQQHHEVVEISRQQLEEGFCGNLLQVRNASGEVLTILSQTAFNALNEAQKSQMSIFGKLVPIPIPTIETVGGGSIRCMMAEIFCPRNQ
jgi:hypothetical protein